MDKLRNYFDSSIVTSSSILVNSGRHPCASVADQGDGDQGSFVYKNGTGNEPSAGCFLRADAGNHRTSTDLLTLSRVLGIFLDNAIEAASETEQKRFHIAIVCKVHSVIFHIENSTKPLLFPLEELFKPSISSKEAHSGLGLPTAIC